MKLLVVFVLLFAISVECGDIEEATGCFHEGVYVRVHTGNRDIETPIPHLRIGDMIKTPSGYEPMLGWLHRDPNESGYFYRLYVDRRSITLSSSHYIVISEACDIVTRAQQAMFVREGWCLVNENGSFSKIDRISKTYAGIGVYSPYVASQTFYAIDGTSFGMGDYFEVTPYAMMYPTLPQRIALKAVMEAYNLATEDPNNIVGIHPYIQNMMDVVDVTSY